MARTALQKVYADFRQGFVSVANPLAFPDGSFKDIVNVDIQDNGTLKKRPGLRYETDTVVSTGASLQDLNTTAISSHVWSNVDNIGGKKIAVVQIGSDLHFFDMLDSGIDLDNPLTSPINIGIPSTGLDKKITAASGEGRFFVAHPSITPLYFTYDNGTILSKEITISIRDSFLWEGRDDNETGFTSATLYPQHEYNLRNGGWPDGCLVSRNEDPNGGTDRLDPVRYTFTKINKYPSVSIPFTAGTAGGGNTVSEQTAYSPWQIDVDYFGNSIAPVGRNIVNAGNFTRTGHGATALSIAGSFFPALNTTASSDYVWEQQPSSIAFYASRVWYAGVRGYDISSVTAGAGVVDLGEEVDVANTIYFSQVLDGNLSKVGKCYQEADPTAEDINQLLATDGGTVSIRGIGEIYDMKEFGTSLVVFSSEGVWSISGSDVNSFKADSFSVNKLSSKGPSSNKTITSSTSNIYYVADDAIYIIVQDEVTGLPSVQDITSGKIKDFYVGISYLQKERAKTLFDASNRILYMFYGEVDQSLEDIANLVYNKCLVFNQDLGCFYKYDIPITQSNLLVDGLFYEKDQTITISTDILVGADTVVVGADTVVLENTYTLSSLNAIQILTLTNTVGTVDFTFSTFTDVDTFLDWGEDYVGNVVFGFDVAGDIMRDSLKAPVIITHMEKTEDGFAEVVPGEVDLIHKSSCILTTGWDWATSYSRPQELYRFNRHYVPSGASDTFDYGQDVITTRNRIRGKGHSLGIQLTFPAGFDARLLGIGILYTNKQRV